MNVAQRSRSIVALGLFLTIISTATAKYGGGSGTADDPYQIATAADLIALGDEPNDYDKHFVLTADLDLDPNLPGGKVFDRAVIAPPTSFDDSGDFVGIPFTGGFDGNGHRLSHLTIKGGKCLGLFGQLMCGADVQDLGIVDARIAGSGDWSAGLVGSNGNWTHRLPGGIIIRSYCTGTVSGQNYVGGLVGYNGGTVAQCYSTGAISGYLETGGLVGCNGGKGTLIQCYSTGVVSGTWTVGGLLGHNFGSSVTHCYSTGPVSGNSMVGGLVGSNCADMDMRCAGDVVSCYSAGPVSGSGEVGGLVGVNDGGEVWHSVWDVETSGQPGSPGAVGLTTDQMRDPCMLGMNGFGGDPNWVLDAGRDYPRLAWEGTLGKPVPEPSLDWLQGKGTEEDPYRIEGAAQLILLGKAGILWDKHLILGADLDLHPALPGRQVFRQAVIPTFSGVFDGKGHAISHLSVTSGDYLGLFGQLTPGAEVRDLRLVDVNVAGSGICIGGLAAANGGTVIQCGSTGVVRGREYVGGLVGSNASWYSPGSGSIRYCRSSCAIEGTYSVGGLVGENYDSTVAQCYSTGKVNGNDYVGGLVGDNGGTVTQCYSRGLVSGTGENVGGLVGSGSSAVSQCLWDSQTSGQATSAGGTGKTTAQMQTIQTFLDAGWGSVDETTNGTNYTWWILEGKDYPRLWWEVPADDGTVTP